MKDIKGTVRKFIETNLIVLEDDIELNESDNIFALGYANSLFVMKLLNFVEREFGLTVDNQEMDIKNFSSIEAITRLVETKLTELNVK